MSPKKEVSHTPKGGYAKAVLDSIVALKERSGSSPQAIIKYVKAHNPQLPEDKLKLQVKLALRRLLKQNLVEKVKASYKVVDKNHTSKRKTKEAKPKRRAKIVQKKNVNQTKTRTLKTKVSDEKREKTVEPTKAPLKSETTETKSLRHGSSSEVKKSSKVPKKTEGKATPKTTSTSSVEKRIAKTNTTTSSNKGKLGKTAVSNKSKPSQKAAVTKGKTSVTTSSKKGTRGVRKA
ncbi:hypothetical protein GpartN1_g2313.t1 [Galdieria partita]|uniref:H15 domain-containing protein n=1 Tax=Galdieria partita TaxID=83374 RepID=A0A9C7UPI2_9RHOD|nr:hypothetical protein GpartN1_g2313.t1 [Galdieria partita]